MREMKSNRTWTPVLIALLCVAVVLPAGCGGGIGEKTVTDPADPDRVVQRIQDFCDAMGTESLDPAMTMVSYNYKSYWDNSKTSYRNMLSNLFSKVNFTGVDCTIAGLWVEGKQAQALVRARWNFQPAVDHVAYASVDRRDMYGLYKSDNVWYIIWIDNEFQTGPVEYPIVRPRQRLHEAGESLYVQWTEAPDTYYYLLQVFQEPDGDTPVYSSGRLGSGTSHTVPGSVFSEEGIYKIGVVSVNPVSAIQTESYRDVDVRFPDEYGQLADEDDVYLLRSVAGRP